MSFSRILRILRWGNISFEITATNALPNVFPCTFTFAGCYLSRSRWELYPDVALIQGSFGREFFVNLLSLYSNDSHEPPPRAVPLTQETHSNPMQTLEGLMDLARTLFLDSCTTYSLMGNHLSGFILGRRVTKSFFKVKAFLVLCHSPWKFSPEFWWWKILAGNSGSKYILDREVISRWRRLENFYFIRPTGITRV